MIAYKFTRLRRKLRRQAVEVVWRVSSQALAKEGIRRRVSPKKPGCKVEGPYLE